MLFLLPILSVCYGTSPLITSSTYNINSYSGLYQYVNNACGGAVGWAIAIVFCVVIFFSATAYADDPGAGLAIAGGVMTMGTILLQFIGINTSVMPLLFGGVALLGVAIIALRGILSPYK